MDLSLPQLNHNQFSTNSFITFDYLNIDTNTIDSSKQSPFLISLPTECEFNKLFQRMKTVAGAANYSLLSNLERWHF